MFLRYKGEPEIGTIICKDDIDAVCNELESFNENGYNHHRTIEAFENAFLQRIGGKYAVSVSSCAVGIDMVLKYLNPQNTDEVLSCAINFHGTHLSIINSGAKLVLVEADQDLNMCVEDLKRKITPNTKAIVVTHMNGLSCDMSSIKELVQGTNIRVIEDAARSLGSRYHDQEVGNESWACIYSFQYKKTITTLGEGGMIVTNDLYLYEALLKYRSFGLGDDWGTNYKMTSVQAAMGISQLKKLDLLIEKRRNLGQYRTKCIEEALSGFLCPTDNSTYYNSYYLYTVLVPNWWDKTYRDELIMSMNSHGITCIVANSPTYLKNKYIFSSCCSPRMRISERIGERIICLPIHPNMTDEDNRYIIETFIRESKRIEKKCRYVQLFDKEFLKSEF